MSQFLRRNDTIVPENVDFIILFGMEKLKVKWYFGIYMALMDMKLGKEASIDREGGSYTPHAKRAFLKNCREVRPEGWDLPYQVLLRLLQARRNCFRGLKRKNQNIAKCY